METSSAIFVFRGTVIKYDVNRQINVSACQCPFDDFGNGPMQTIAQPANDTCWVSKCISCVYTLLGRN